MYFFFDKIVLADHCGFRKSLSVQHCLVALLEKWTYCNGKGKPFGAPLLRDLSKTFDFLS